MRMAQRELTRKASAHCTNCDPMRDERDDDRADRHRADDRHVVGGLLSGTLPDDEVSRRVIMSA